MPTLTDHALQAMTNPWRLENAHAVGAYLTEETIRPLADRVERLVRSGRRVTLVRVVGPTDHIDCVRSSLRVMPEGSGAHPILRHRDGGISVAFKQTAQSLALSAEGWERNADLEHCLDEGTRYGLRGRDFGHVEIVGGEPAATPCWGDMVIVRYWNDRGVCTTCVWSFDHPGDD